MSSINTIAIGNFALSDIYVSGKIVSRDNYDGICFRIALAFAYLGATLDCFSVIGKEQDWENIIQIFADNRVNLIQNRKINKSLRFDWFYEKGDQLNNLLIHNSEIMDQLAMMINDKQLEKYSHIILCSLGLNNEQSVIRKIDKKSKLSYIFHESNLDSASAEDYLTFFELVDNLFINEKEVYAITGCDNLKLAGELISKNTRCFITLGERGSVVFNNGKLQLELPAVKTTDYNSAGAGDTYAGGVLAALSLNFPLNTACRLGSLLASATLNDYLTNNLQKLL